jgi:hypothetical protein
MQYQPTQKQRPPGGGGYTQGLIGSSAFGRALSPEGGRGGRRSEPENPLMGAASKLGHTLPGATPGMHAAAKMLPGVAPVLAIPGVGVAAGVMAAALGTIAVSKIAQRARLGPSLPPKRDEENIRVRNNVGVKAFKI